MIITELILGKQKQFAIGMCLFAIQVFSQNAVVNVTSNTKVMDNPKLLLGVTFDSRTSMMGKSNYGLLGYYKTDGTIIPEIDQIFNDFPLSTLRYPGNGIAVGFDWKKSIGATTTRPNQNLLGALGNPQPVLFGFDEFMAMTASKGVAAADVQIMVPIYDSSTSGLTSTQLMAAIPNVISNNADWVEYANAPNDGSNPGGGIDWAAVRATNGHPTPYGIKIWNIGNEPWATAEFGASAANFDAYATSVTPIIDAMLAIDPTIKITIPTTGNSSSTTTWAYAAINSILVAQGKIYALSQHYFPTENVTNGVAPSQGIAAVSTHLNSLIAAASKKGIKVFIGDYAHNIPSNPTTEQKDIAMQWQGSNLNTDMLLMLSQINSMERANFWVYGMPYAVWHPIRINSIGNYSILPAASIYKLLSPAFLDQSIYTSTTSPASSDGNPYSIRASAFISNDNTKMNIIAVNRDKSNSIPLQVNALPGYSLKNSRLLYGTDLTSETITETNISPNGNGMYDMPAISVLILEFSSQPLEITSFEKTSAIKIFQNPNNSTLQFSETLHDIEVYDIVGKIIISKIDRENQLDTRTLTKGIYFIHTNEGTFKFVKE